MNDLEPLALLKPLLRRFPLILLAVVAGGIFGLFFSRTLTPSFESTAIIRTTVQVEDPAALSLGQLRYYLNPVRTVLLADRVLEEASARLGIEQASELRLRLQLDDQRGIWRLTVRDQDPQRAADKANAWAQAGIEALSQSISKAHSAGTIQGELVNLGCSAVRDAWGLLPVDWECGPAALQGGAEEMLLKWRQAVDETHGIGPNLGAEWTSSAMPDFQPAVGVRGAIVLASSFIGFIAASAGFVIRAQTSIEVHAPDQAP